MVHLFPSNLGFNTCIPVQGITVENPNFLIFFIFMFKIVYFTKKIQKNHSKYSEQMFITMENYGAAHSNFKRNFILIYFYVSYIILTLPTIFFTRLIYIMATGCNIPLLYVKLNRIGYTFCLMLSHHQTYFKSTKF